MIEKAAKSVGREVGSEAFEIVVAKLIDRDHHDQIGTIGGTRCGGAHEESENEKSFHRALKTTAAVAGGRWN
jgi:hypothetical protein